MARRTPVGVIDGTDTSGTGSYNLTHPAAASDRQNISDAYALGILADSDVVAYKVSDDQTSGSSLDYEWGLGTLSSSGNVLSRDTILESSNGGIGGSKVSWTAGGERTVTIVIGDIVVADNNGSEFTDPATFATNLGLPRLAASNIFTAIQEISTSSETQIRLNSTAAARTWAWRLQSDGVLRLRDVEAGGVPIAFPGGGSGNIDISTNYTLRTSAGNKYDAFPSGTKMMFGATPPAGWTRVNETQSRVIRMAKSGDTIGATGGADDIFDGAWTTDETVLTEAQIPSHTHDVLTRADAGTLDGHVMTNALGGGETNRIISAAAQATGGGGSHNHAMFTPHYTIACWATKD